MNRLSHDDVQYRWPKQQFLVNQFADFASLKPLPLSLSSLPLSAPLICTWMLKIKQTVIQHPLFTAVGERVEHDVRVVMVIRCYHRIIEVAMA